jgi:transposase
MVGEVEWLRSTLEKKEAELQAVREEIKSHFKLVIERTQIFEP